jgi:aldehyde dehydrogenase (NAD+)
MDDSVSQLLALQRAFFLSQQTKSVLYRKTVLQQFYNAIVSREDAICDAIYADFKKPKFEVLLSETQLVLAELNLTLKKLDSWSAPKRIKSSLLNFPSSDTLYKEPYGNVLVIAPWNYPFMLALMPFIGAIAAGNTVVLKPSEKAPETSGLIAGLIKDVFSPEHAAVVIGGVSVAQALLNQKWDYIFFTGSTQVGRIVHASAARHLTPVTLELGGKNPCIIDETATIDLAAKRIVWGKFFNAGQTCVAPDYLLVHHSIKHLFMLALIKQSTRSYGEDVIRCPDFARIINREHLNMLKEKLVGEKVIFGGLYDDTDCFLSPTLVDSPRFDSKLMQEEIFGPILPILTFHTEADIDACLSRFDKPLATYIFSTNTAFQKRLLARYSFGGGAINDTWIYLANHRLPFGGVGQSGMGGYHGKRSFDTFTHFKPISKKANWLDIPLRYAPYRISMAYIKRLKHFF